MVTCNQKVLANALARIGNLENEVNDLREQNIDLREYTRVLRQQLKDQEAMLSSEGAVKKGKE